MKHLILAPMLALALSGCGPMLGALAGVGSAPAPLARTTIDDRALETAWKTFDVALDAINLLTDRGIIVPGTPRARSIATAIRKVNRSLAAAERFAAAGSATEYGSALNEALAGVSEIRTALGSES
jgi:uncharacterized protein YceK